MRAIIVFYICLLAIFTAGCKKERPVDEDQESQFTFNVKKNGIDWETKSATAYYNKTDNSYYVTGFGDNGEHLQFMFKKEPLTTGKLKEFNMGVSVTACPICSSLSASYTLDRSKTNKFEIIGFDNLQNLIAARFNVHLKRERIYEDEEFTEELSSYEGLFSIRYEDSGL